METKIIYLIQYVSIFAVAAGVFFLSIGQIMKIKRKMRGKARKEQKEAHSLNIDREFVQAGGKYPMQEYLGAAVMVVDRNQKIMIANEEFRQAFCSLNIISRETSISDFLKHFISAIETKPTDLIKDMLWTSNEITQGEIRFLNGVFEDNREAYFRVTARKIIEAGEIVATVVSFHDITKDKEIIELVNQKNKELMELKEKAESAVEIKNAFLASVSHEIRTPMNTIYGMAAIILREKGISEETKENAQSITSASKALLEIINNILDLSKMEAGKMEVLEDPYEINQLITALHKTAQVGLENTNVVYEADIMAGLPKYFIGDFYRIKQILLNLLSNAIKFTKEGKIIIHMHGAVSQENSKGYELIIAVEDTGIGIKIENQKKLFEPFEQLQQGAVHGVEGTGLGLSICKRLVDAMEGTLKLESVYGKGSKITVCLPQQIVEEEAVLQKDSPQMSDSHKMVAPEVKILVVDDNALNLKVAQKLIRFYEINTRTVLSGDLAIELLKSETFDLIFMDHMMPVKDGVQTSREIREMGIKTPIIALTANAVIGSREYLLAQGISDYISKPIEIETLYQMLRFWIPQEKWVEKENVLQEEELSLMETIVESGEEKIEEMKKFYEARDFSALTIQTHALKNTAAIAGEMALSNLSKQLEDAGKANDIAFIEKNIQECFALYNQLILRTKGEIQASQNRQGEELRNISLEELCEKITLLEEKIQNYDSFGSESIIRDLLNCHLSEDVKMALENIKSKLLTFHWKESNERLSLLLYSMEEKEKIENGGN